MFIQPEVWVSDWLHVHVDVAAQRSSHVATRYSSMAGRTGPVMARPNFCTAPFFQNMYAESKRCRSCDGG